MGLPFTNHLKPKLRSAHLWQSKRQLEKKGKFFPILTTRGNAKQRQVHRLILLTFMTQPDFIFSHPPSDTNTRGQKSRPQRNVTTTLAV